MSTELSKYSSPVTMPSQNISSKSDIRGRSSSSAKDHYLPLAGEESDHGYSLNSSHSNHDSTVIINPAIDANYISFSNIDNPSSTQEIDYMSKENLQKIPVRPLSPFRWLILALFCLCSIQQDMAWLLLSPIEREIGTAFGPKWNPSFITWTLNLGNISFLICTLPIAWLVPRYGRRFSTLLVIGTTTFANMLRLMPVDVNDESSNSLYRGLMLWCCAVVGIGGPWSMIGGPILAETWFPIHERVTATAMGIMAPFVGQTLTFLIGPLVVGQIQSDPVDQKHRILVLFWGVLIVNLMTFLACYVSVSKNAFASWYMQYIYMHVNMDECYTNHQLDSALFTSRIPASCLPACLVI